MRSRWLSVAEKTYAATLLPPNEWAVLDALVTAHKEGETPCNWQFLSSEYESLADVTEPLEEVLERLHRGNMAGQDLATTLWFPTPYGVAVTEFQEKTAVMWGD